VEHCRLLWEQGSRGAAISQLKSLLPELECGGVLEQAAAKCRLARWMSAQRSEPREVIERLFVEAVRTADGAGGGVEANAAAARAHFDFAQVMDAQFQTQCEKISSAEWIAARKLLDAKGAEQAKCEGAFEASKAPYTRESNPNPLRRHIERLRRQCDAIREEQRVVVEDKKRFLVAAIEHYIAALSLCDKYDTSAVFRLCSLWFADPDNALSCQHMADVTSRVDTRKFIPLLYQIASRLSSDAAGSTFQPTLSALVERIAMEHPHHALWVLSALRNGDRLHPGAEGLLYSKDRIVAAREILDRLRRRKELGQHVRQLESLVEAYFDLAFLDVAELKKRDQQQGQLPAKLARIGPLDRVAVATDTIAVDPEVSVPATITAFAPTFQLVGGINKPKRIECTGSDGRTRLQLVKAKDDLRQDAVMEQVFAMVNSLLRECSSSRATWRRQLTVRTYKVVPLSPSAGLLEWV
jgi:ataxia telangiectasia mutated family protein